MAYYYIGIPDDSQQHSSSSECQKYRVVL